MMPYINVHAYIIYIMLFYPKICLLNVNEEEQGGMTRKNDRLFSSTKVRICFISAILFTSFFSLVSAFLSIE